MSDDDDKAIFDRLVKRPTEELSTIEAAVVPRDLRAQLPSNTAPPAAHAVALYDLAAQSPEIRDRLRRRLPDPIAGWLDWGQRSYGTIRVVGFQDKYKIRLPLDRIFVSLCVQPRGRAETPEEARAGFKQGRGAEPRKATLAEALALANETHNTAGIVLLGDPGAGKTTLLYHLLTRVAQHGSAAVGLADGLIPVYIRCNSITAEDRRSYGLKDVLRRQAAKDGYPQAGQYIVDESLPVLFLLDGLDEVRDKPTRAAVCDWLGQEVCHWRTSRFVVTSRYTAFRDEARLDNQFVRVDVEWLDPPRVRDFVKRWFQAVEEGLRTVDKPAERAEEQADALLRVVLDPERQRQHRLREMTENPLLLSTLCLVHHSDVRLPDKRGQLYDRCISLLVETWPAHAGRPSLNNAEARLVLEPLAHAMHAQRAKDIPSEAAQAILRAPMARVPGLALTPEELLTTACEHCGILASRDIGSYEFFHLSFQEYLTAAHIKEAGLAAELAGHADDPWWHDVILLGMSMRGVFAPFMRALLQNGLFITQGALVRACLDETVELDEAPFVEVLDRILAQMAEPREGIRAWLSRLVKGPAVDLSPLANAILTSLRGRPFAGVLARAEKLLQHPDQQVASAARALLGLPVVEQVTDKPAGEGVWQAPVTGMSLVWVPPGTFWMGSSKTPGERGYAPDAYQDETPTHEVQLTRGYWMGEHPVTNAEYQVFLAEKKRPELPYWQNRRFNAPGQPVVTVSFEDALLFCDWLTRKLDPQDGWCFDLPTETEWEYAARGTDGRRYPWGNEAPTPERACFGLPLDSGSTMPVGGRPAGKSPFGCQDMAGNVWEWCRDAWRVGYGNRMTKDIDPCHQGDLRGAPRLLRGGSWFLSPWFLRCALRGRAHPEARAQHLGFRVVCRVSRQPWPIEP